jgi:hypothetical protein
MNRQVLFSMVSLSLATATAGAQGNPRPDSAAKAQAAVRVIAPAYRNRIVGVYDAQTYQPIEGVEVSDVMAGNKSLTSSTGNVSLFFLPEGASLVRIRKLGYESQTFMVEIAPKDSSPITIVLSRVAELAPVVTTSDSAPHHISPGLREFDERKKAGFGYFIDEAQLRKDEGQPLSNEIVGHVPGVIMTLRGALVSGRPNCNGAALNNCRPGNCAVAVYQDGVRLTPAPDFTRIETDDYAGIEFYASPTSVPAQYGGRGAGCGVLLLWTRER